MLDFKYRRKKRILHHGFSTGYRYKRGKYIWANSNSNGSLGLRNFFYIIKIINYLPAVIVVAVYYTIISSDVAETEFIFCIFYQSKSSSSEGFSDGNLLRVVVIFELFLVAVNQVTN